MNEIKKMQPRKVSDSQNQTMAIVAVVMVAALAVALIILFVVGGKGRNTGRGIAAQTSGTVQSSGTSSAAQPTLTIEQVEVPPLSVYRRRNPFKPLINLEQSAAVTPTTSATTGAGAAGTVTIPPQLEPPGSPSAGEVISRAVTLEGVFEQGGKKSARIWVADRLFEAVAVGDIFGDNYKLLAIGRDASATILYGDERFTVFVGQSIYW
ncbi:MAG: hypothetical protein MUO75_05980 [Actinobacteria bacterium]|nr:hypothetical protein [Actinomycetota bacterium]